VHFSLIEHNPPGDFIAYLIATFSWHRFSAISLWILVLFLIYHRVDRPSVENSRRSVEAHSGAPPGAGDPRAYG